MLKEALMAYSKEIGFDRIGVTSASRPNDYNRYLAWVDRGLAGNMWYLTEATRVKKRGDLSKILPGAKSVIVGAISYAPQKSNRTSEARVARYAWGEDYHKVVGDALKQLEAWLRSNTDGPFESRMYVDTGPILERSLAERAGVGWIGKNTCVMHESTGSYLYLGELITTLDLPEDKPAINHCGSCTKCLDACPSNAFTKAYELDAEKCISYQTIENRDEEIPKSMANHLDGWVAGCDICQEVCPWNKEPAYVRLEPLFPKSHAQLSLEEADALSEADFKRIFGFTSLRRITWRKFRKNVQTALRFRGSSFNS